MTPRQITGHSGLLKRIPGVSLEDLSLTNEELTLCNERRVRLASMPVEPAASP
ncbi:MAG TPA: hypothetical protein VMJ93_05665 [Verrucomicrobiae bacterium]|nr:hypothetical protein [Verrucomicrobiae bacterium]